MLIINGSLITYEKPNRILADHAMWIKDGLIADIGPQTKLVSEHPDDEIVDAQGRYIMPGNICAHTHFYSAYSRGMALAGSPPQNFTEILQKLWWPLDRALDKSTTYYSAMVSLIDAIKHGTTTLFDHHASPNFVNGSLDTIAEAVRTSGLRASLSYEVTDRNGLDGTKSGIEENLRFIRNLHGNNPQHLLTASFGLHASLTLSESTLKLVREALPGGTGIHIHVAEDMADQYDSLAKYGERVIDRLVRHNLLVPNSILAHGVHLDNKEIEQLRSAQVYLTHQPRSNMNNAVGLGDVESVLRSGVKVCLGNDGFSNSMWEEWKTAYLGQRLWHRDNQRLGGYDLYRIAIENNAELATNSFGIKIGELATGFAADLIFVDYHPFTPFSADNFPWHVVFGFHDSFITDTMVHGKFLMRDRKLSFIDEAKITQEAFGHAAEVWARYQKNMASGGQ
ncbi:MAG: putative aminohydrolase SsnA [Anaerolineaceae bacterium]|nr:putative aminohydrolase SsnA [Anaerolineaceae bacterium]